jgi:hypothetical protein
LVSISFATPTASLVDDRRRARISSIEFAEKHSSIHPGIYDIGSDDGWVSVGDVADTAEFAVESIRRWWDTLGGSRFPNATRLMITADSGGSNGYRVRA